MAKFENIRELDEMLSVSEEEEQKYAADDEARIKDAELLDGIYDKDESWSAEFNSQPYKQ